MPSYSIAQAKDQLARLVDEALAGQPVAITRDGKAIVSLVASAPLPKPITAEYLDRIRVWREEGPSLGADSVTLVRAMRDEEP